MFDKTLRRLNLFIDEFKKTKKESITTVSAGVPGDGPIADIQNGLSITSKDDETIKKNKELLKSFMFKRIHEGSNLSVEELISAIDLDSMKKKFGKNFNSIWKEVEKKIIVLKSQLHLNLSSKEMEELKKSIEKLV